MDKKIRKLLYRSFDEDLNDKERKKLENALHASEPLMREKEELAACRQALIRGGKRSFSKDFADRVLLAADAPENSENGLVHFYNTLTSVFKPVAITGAILMLVLIFYNLGKVKSLPMEDLLFAPDAAIEEILHMPLF